jgi:hypothetical protein
MLTAAKTVALSYRTESRHDAFSLPARQMHPQPSNLMGLLLKGLFGNGEHLSTCGTPMDKMKMHP